MHEPRHIAILGAGPGGYVAAIRGAQLGARVTVVEPEALGGVCLNWGCIPSKALLSVVELGEKVKAGGELGLRVSGAVQYDLPQMVKRKNAVVATLVKGIATLFKTWGITHLSGRGGLVDERTIRVTKPDGATMDIEADAIIVATGSSSPSLPLFPVDGRRIITSREALDLPEVPARLLIVGGGVEGCEFASLYAGLGSQVTLVEMMATILPMEDAEVARLMTRELTKRGVQVITERTIDSVDVGSDHVTATFGNGESLMADVLLVSVGRGFNTSGIGLDAVGVRLGSRGEIDVNDRMETSVPGIYAIGDVVGKSMLAHVASAQGKVAVENILGRPQTMDDHVVPAGIFTLPEIGRVGLTEQQALERGHPLQIGRFRYAGLGKAQAVGDTAGLVKMITDAQSGKILGVHIVGAHATDLVHEAALAMHVGARVRDLARMIHAHPTFAEGLLEAAEDVEGLAVHQARKRA